MLSWGKFLAGLASIVQWFQRQFELGQARQDGRNERDAATYQKVLQGREARDLVSSDAAYADKLLSEISLGTRDEQTDDGQLLSQLRSGVHSRRNSGDNKAWHIEKLLNIPTALYRYSKSSLGKLSTCHAELQLPALKLTKKWDATVVCGTRSLEKQQEAYDSGASKVPPGKSKHNRFPSDAIDIVPAEAPRLWREGKDLPFEVYKEFATDFIALAAEDGITLRWGGDWDMDGDSTDQTFMDLGHFERTA